MQVKTTFSCVYFRIEEGLYAEQLGGLVLSQTQVGHDVVLSEPQGGIQRVLFGRAVPLHFRENTGYNCEREEIYF